MNITLSELKIITAALTSYYNAPAKTFGCTEKKLLNITSTLLRVEEMLEDGTICNLRLKFDDARPGYLHSEELEKKS